MIVLNFFSDGPTTQYRQKGNFYLLSTLLQERGIRLGTWNFHEAGHGKDVPDGVGAAIKRNAEQVVRSGIDFTDAYTLYQQLKDMDSKVSLYYVSVPEVESAVNKFSVLTKCVLPGTMRLHQLVNSTKQKVSRRVIRCFCQKDRLSTCYDLNRNEILYIHSNASLEANEVTLNSPNCNGEVQSELATVSSNFT